MKVVFVNPAQEMGAYQCLSAYIKERGHDAALVNDPRLADNPWISFPTIQKLVDQKKEIGEQVLEHKPDLIGFSVVADDFQWAIEWASYLKGITDVPIVFGNIFPTTQPHRVLSNSYVDYVVRGEGEETLYQLMESLEKALPLQDILGLGYKLNSGEIVVNPMRPLFQDMDVLPFPDKDLMYQPMPYLNYGYTTMTGRGCPYKCTFCDNNTSAQIYRQEGLKGKWTRRHSPEYVVEEILWAQKKYGIEHVRFNDEDFSYSKKWTREFCRLYKQKGTVPWFAWVYPNTVDDEVAKLMADAGCDSVEMGVQSGSTRLRNDIIKRRTPEDKIIDAMQSLRRHGICCVIDIIVGLPTETKADLDHTVDVILRGQPWHLYAFWLTYYDTAEITSLAKEKGLLTEEELAKIENGENTRGSISGGTELEKSSLTRRYHTFILLLPVLPTRFSYWMLKNDLIRFTPKLNPFVLVNITKLIKSNPYEEFRRRTLAMYASELPRAFFRVICKGGKALHNFLVSPKFSNKKT